MHTFFPPDFALPIVAPADLGRVAARLLTVDIDQTSVRYVEGPTDYSAADVARAFAEALGRNVRTTETPPSEWLSMFQALGFSPVAAASYARMITVTLDGPERPDTPERGRTTLAEYVNALVRHA